MRGLENVVLILSGGMDSATLLYKLVYEHHYKFQSYNVYALSFDYGQKHKKELECAQKLCDKLGVNHKIVDLSVLNDLAPSALTREDIAVPDGHYASENMKVTVVPNRNMVMLSLAISYAIGLKATKVFYGAHKGDHDIYPDCRPEFVEAMMSVAEICDFHPIKIEAPFLGLDKGDIAIIGKELGVDYINTWTCYKGFDKACGKCGSCTERLEAFAKAGMKDPIEYE